jgi:hypothetical protein
MFLEWLWASSLKAEVTPEIGFVLSLSEIWVINESLPLPARARARLDSLARSMQDPRPSDDNDPPGMTN